MGDGFLATFGSAARAVAAAVGIQQGIDAQRFVEPHVALALRIGLGLGDVTVEDGDVFGTPVIEAARLCRGRRRRADPRDERGRGTGRAGRGGHTFTPVGGPGAQGPARAGPDRRDRVERVDRRRRRADPALRSPHAAAYPFQGGESRASRRADQAWWKRSLHAEHRVVRAHRRRTGDGQDATRLGVRPGARQQQRRARVLPGRCDEELGVWCQPSVEAFSRSAARPPRRRSASPTSGRARRAFVLRARKHADRFAARNRRPGRPSRVVQRWTSTGCAERGRLLAGRSGRDDGARPRPRRRPLGGAAEPSCCSATCW